MITLRAPDNLVARVDAYAQANHVSRNRAMLDLLEQALDCQRQGLLDQILEEVQSLREDLDRARRLRKKRAWAKRQRELGQVLEAKVVE